MDFTLRCCANGHARSLWATCFNLHSQVLEELAAEGRRHSLQRQEWEALLTAAAAQHGQLLQEQATELSDLRRLHSDLEGNHLELQHLHFRLSADQEVLIESLRAQAMTLEDKLTGAKRGRDVVAGQLAELQVERDGAAEQVLHLMAELSSARAEAERRQAELNARAFEAEDAQLRAEKALSEACARHEADLSLLRRELGDMHHEAAEGLRASYATALRELEEGSREGREEAARRAEEAMLLVAALSERCLELEQCVRAAELLAETHCQNLQARLQQEMAKYLEALAAVEHRGSVAEGQAEEVERLSQLTVEAEGLRAEVLHLGTALSVKVEEAGGLAAALLQREVETEGLRAEILRLGTALSSKVEVLEATLLWPSVEAERLRAEILRLGAALLVKAEEARDLEAALSQRDGEAEDLRIKIRQLSLELERSAGMRILEVQDGSAALLQLQELCSTVLNFAAEAQCKGKASDLESTLAIQADLASALSALSNQLAECEELRQRCLEAEAERDKAANDLEEERRGWAEASATEAARSDFRQLELMHMTQ